MANKSPPMPFIIGETTPIMALVAIAASTALPPDSRIRTPACAASGDSAATIPFSEITIERFCDRSCVLLVPAAINSAATASIAFLVKRIWPTGAFSL